MFGKNKTFKIQKDDDPEMPVKEIFATIQGEGPYSGQRAIFIRLGRCSLKCHYCDTEFETDLVNMTASQIVEKAKSLSGNIELAVITGGEPLLWKGTADLCQGLFDEGYLVQVETSGSVVQENFLHVVGKAWVDVVCSPKTPKIAKGLIGLVDCFKYVIKAGEVAEDGLPNMSTQIEGKESEIFRPDPLSSKKIYVSPCDEHDPVKNAANIAECVRSVMKHGYTLSLQTHKVIGMP